MHVANTIAHSRCTDSLGLPSKQCCLVTVLCILVPDNVCRNKDGLMKPVAIELAYSNSGSYTVYTPKDPPNIWLLAKVLFMSIDSGYHQLYSHFVRTHASVEPYLISTRRRLSPTHPVSNSLNCTPTWCGMCHFKNIPICAVMAVRISAIQHCLCSATTHNICTHKLLQCLPFPQQGQT